MMWRSGRLVAAFLGALLLAAPLAGEAQAGRKPTVSARINGKQLKASGRRAFASYGDLILLISGTNPKRPAVRTIAFGCAPVDLAAVTFPYTCAGGGTYQEVRTRPTSARGWGTVHGLHVTIEEFSGTRIRGTFSGTFESGNQNGTQPLPPIAVENGTFNVPMR